MVRTRTIAAVLALVVLVPAVLYQARFDAVSYLGLSVVSILVIAASLYFIFSPTDGTHA